MITEDAAEEKLLENIRKLNAEQKEKLLSLIESFANSPSQNFVALSDAVNQLRTEANQNNLTEAILTQILSEKN